MKVRSPHKRLMQLLKDTQWDPRFSACQFIPNYDTVTNRWLYEVYTPENELICTYYRTESHWVGQRTRFSVIIDSIATIPKDIQELLEQRSYRKFDSMG